MPYTVNSNFMTGLLDGGWLDGHWYIDWWTGVKSYIKMYLFISNRCRLSHGCVSVFHRCLWHQVLRRVQPSCSDMDGEPVLPVDRLSGHVVHRGIRHDVDLHDTREVPVHRLPIPALPCWTKADPVLTDLHLVARIYHCRYSLLG